MSFRNLFVFQILIAERGEMKKVENVIGGLDIIEFRNTGPRVIFLHGGPGCLGYMESFCESFSPFCNTVYYNQRGSKQSRDKIGVADHLSDLKRIVRFYTDESKPIVVGHSWGAMLAVLFAGGYSDLIQKVVLLGCGPLNKIQGQEFQRELCVRFGERKDYYDQLWEAIENESDETKQQIHADRYIDEMMEIYQNDPYSGLEIQPRRWDFKASYQTMCESDELVSKNEYEHALAGIDVPLTIIHGTYDVISPASLFALAKKYVPHVKTYELEKAGHYPWAGPCREDFLEILKLEVV